MPTIYCTLYKHTFKCPQHTALHRNSSSHTDFYPAEQKKYTFTCPLPSLHSTETHIHRLTAILYNTETHIPMPTAILHSEETHKHMNHTYCSLHKHTFTCSLHTALYRNIHSHAHWYLSLCRNTLSHAHCSHALYRSTHSYVHCILHSTVTYTHMPSDTLPSAEIHIHMAIANLHSTVTNTHMPTAYYPLQKHTLTWPLPFCTLKKDTFTCPMHTALNRNTHSYSHCHAAP